MKRKTQRGAILLETVLVLGLLFVSLFECHLALIREGRERLQTLQQARMRYDGKKTWNWAR